jgi:hypothetical protein
MLSLKAFRTCRHGDVTAMFLLLAIPILGFVGTQDTGAIENFGAGEVRQTRAYARSLRCADIHQMCEAMDISD